jgi:hypothetical protein
MSLITQNDQFTQIVAADGKDYSFLPQWPGPMMSVSIQNLSSVDVQVRDNAGRAFVVTAANNRTVNLPAEQIIVRSLTVGTGIIGVTVYAVEQSANDTGGSVLANIINSTITAIIQGTVNANVSGTVNANILNSVLTTTIQGTVNALVSGTVNATITNSTLATTISGTVTTSIANAVLNMQDVVVENNTTAMAGVLANTVIPLSLVQNVTFDTTIAKAVQGFALVLNNPEGFLSVWYTASGQDIFLTRQFPFYWASNNTWQPIEKQFAVDMPAGTVLHLLFRQGLNNPVTGTLKY